MKRCGWVVSVLLAILMVTGTAWAEFKRDTRTLALKNGLEVLLVHDAKVHRSAAALAVGTGMLYDPDDLPGFAHYLEHMLFLGTKKYPEVGSYKKYLDENSGASNAYTSLDVTNFFFEVSHNGFEGALDRFSDFFKEPLFDETYSEREINAVSSEHDKNKRSDDWRLGRLETLAAKEGHPLRKFGTGNKDTLAGATVERLRGFFNKYYAASNMKLAILSDQTLDEQEALVKKYFGDVPDRKVTLPKIDSDYRPALKDKFRLLKVKAVKDLRSLEVEFPTIRLADHHDSKPSAVISSILGHEGKGSLLSKLKEEGLALGLAAGGGYGHPDINSFSINIALTPKGVEQYERVLELVYSYIRLVKEHGIEKYTYDELASMAQINFDWKDPDEGMGYVAGRAALMFDFKLNEVETLPYLFKKFDPDTYKAVLSTLTPENSLVALRTNSVETDKVEEYYGAEYSLSYVGGESFRKLEAPPETNGMFYPEKNDFIPDHLHLLKEAPHLVWDDSLARVWFQFDHRFEQPKVFMQFRIETPQVYDSVQDLMKAKLYDAAIHEGLNELVYPIQLAGLSYSLSLEKKGIILSIGGYSERLDELLRLVVKNLKEVKIDERKFEDLKEVMLRGLENQKLDQAYHRGEYYNTLLWLKKHYSDEERIEALNPLKLDDIREYARRVYEKVYITGVGNGNWTDADMKKSVKTLLSQLNAEPLPEKDRYKIEVEVMEPQERVLFSRKVLDNNNSISYTLQVGEKNFDRLARASLIASIVESDFYTQMRTNQQLGYIVWSFKQTIEDRLFFKMIVQSATYDPFELNKRVEGWLATTGDLFDKLTDEEFERHRASLIVSLEKEGDSIAEVLGDLYYMATEEKGDFKYKSKLIESVKGMRKEDAVAEAKRLFVDPSTPRLVVLMQSGESQVSTPAGTISEVDQFKKKFTVQSSLETGKRL
ncbi:MAG: peptidase M16 [Nitrospinae bacterium CG11_big_fil_rev_8_21_14_0_20_56_8]|nr:MAG: peptidase M16 [Nitrospinae bacterium CG11_big_fil_rev_8_21_14_0_20_56_8]